jgi:hypothetical protein
MDHETRSEVLNQIAAIQSDTASVTVQIGGVDGNNQVEHDTLYIKDAPARIIDELAGMGYSLSVSDGDVRVW